MTVAAVADPRGGWRPEAALQGGPRGRLLRCGYCRCCCGYCPLLRVRLLLRVLSVLLRRMPVLLRVLLLLPVLLVGITRLAVDGIAAAGAGDPCFIRMPAVERRPKETKTHRQKSFFS